VKLVTAIVRPHAVDDIKTGLQEIGIEGLTLSEVRGYGRQRGHTEVYRGAEYTVEFVPKMRLEVLCPTERLDEVVETIVKHGRSGQVGDGKVFVTPVERVVRIRTGEEDLDAL
jgi:nitrogen regulatory protein P-II 1